MIEFRNIKKTVGLAAVAAVSALALAGTANAVVVPFGGTANGVDPLGHSYTTSNAGAPAWGEPGLGLGTLVFNPGSLTIGDGSPDANEFDFIFLKGEPGAIDQTPASGPGGYETTTRFSANGVLWTPHFVNNGHEVDFIAPAGLKIAPGDSFFVNVAFTQPVDLQKFSFAGLWTFNAVPEPATWAMMLLGMGGLGAMLRSRRSAALA